MSPRHLPGRPALVPRLPGVSLRRLPPEAQRRDVRRTRLCRERAGLRGAGERRRGPRGCMGRRGRGCSVRIGPSAPGAEALCPRLPRRQSRGAAQARSWGGGAGTPGPCAWGHGTPWRLARHQRRGPGEDGHPAVPPTSHGASASEQSLTLPGGRRWHGSPRSAGLALSHFTYDVSPQFQEPKETRGGFSLL